MATRLTGRAVGKELCRALGLDPNNVAAITIEVKPDEIVTAVTRTYADDGQWREVLETLVMVCPRCKEGGE
jgi:hypothetical protein